MNITTIGIDVSKQKIDICIYCSKETFTLTNDLSGFKQLLKKIRKMQLEVSRIIIEHTGGYQRDLVKFLINNDLPVCVVNPASVRHFAKAAGYLAKTDKIDAFVLALYGEKLQPKLTVLKDEHLLVLRDLVNQRKQLSNWNKQTKQWLEKQPGKQWQKRIKSQQMWLEKQLKQVRKEIRDFIKAHEDLCSRYNALLSVRGVGEDTAASKYAPSVCGSGSVCGAGEWYLPSAGELKTMWTNVETLNVGLVSAGSARISSDYHWSSTEYNSRAAWYVAFGNNDRGVVKTEGLLVRPVLSLKPEGR